MERYLRFYIKFQGYMIGGFTLLLSILMTLVIFESNDPYYPMEFCKLHRLQCYASFAHPYPYLLSLPFNGRIDYNYRFMGTTALVLGIFWFIAGVTFMYGVHYEIKQCLLPFALLYLVDLALLAIRDIVMIWHDRRWYSMVFVNIPTLLAVLYITCYLFMTLVALGRLFSTDPKPQTGDNFVRFSNGIANPVALAEEEEAALVAE
uniref:Uncharacterized protein n=1 Tax=Anopheles quadriannulatus TaxID=34691 RepID=A0A182WZ21_ANOQN